MFCFLLISKRIHLILFNQILLVAVFALSEAAVEEVAREKRGLALPGNPTLPGIKGINTISDLSLVQINPFPFPFVSSLAVFIFVIIPNLQEISLFFWLEQGHCGKTSLSKELFPHYFKEWPV